MKTLVSAVVTAAATLAASAGVTTHSFDLMNHTDGGVNPQLYGLRMDNFAGQNPFTFSFEDLMGDSTMQAVVTADDGTGAATLQIFGEMSGNTASGGSTVGTFALDVTYSGSWDAMTEQFIATTADAFSGSITAIDAMAGSPLANGESVSMMPKPNNAGRTFLFGLDLPGSRLDAGDDSYEGFGWVSSSESSGTQDFLFRAVRSSGGVPTPGTAALLAAGGLVASRRRR